MSQTTLSIRMDEELKKNFGALCEELGMNMTTAFTIFAKQALREQRIPFDICVDPFYSEANLAALNESIEQMKQGKVVVKTLAELEKMADE